MDFSLPDFEIPKPPGFFELPLLRDYVDEPAPALGGKRPTGPVTPYRQGPCVELDPDAPAPVPGPGLGVDLSKVDDYAPPLTAKGRAMEGIDKAREMANLFGDMF